MQEGAKRSPTGVREDASPIQSFLRRLVCVSERAGVLLGLAMVLIVAAGLVMAVRDGDRIKSLDEPAFLDLSSNLAFHLAFAHTNRPHIEGYDPRLPLGELRPTAYRAPGYAWLQAPFRRLGGGYAALRVVNSLLLALTLWVLYSLLVRRTGRLGGLLGIALVFSYPVLFHAAVTLYPQTLAAFLLVASLWQLDRLDRFSRLGSFCLVGLTYGALLLTAPIYLLLAPLVLGWMMGSRRFTPKQVAATTLAIAASAGLWIARNTVVLHAPVGLATSAGFNLLAGNGPYVRYDQATADLRWPKGVREQVIGKGEAERDRILTRAAVAWMRENPEQAAILYLKKLLYWFSFRNPVVSDRIVPGGSAAGPPWLRDLIMLLGYGVLVAILLLRFAMLRRHPLSALEVLFLTLYLGGAMAYAIYFTRIRFRLPFDWLLIAVDAMFLAWLLKPEEPTP